jgi:hypothetical protein
MTSTIFVHTLCASAVLSSIECDRWTNGDSCEGGGSTSCAQEPSVVYRKADDGFGANVQIQPATAEFATLHA